jgi:hypothetical protein
VGDRVERAIELSLKAAGFADGRTNISFLGRSSTGEAGGFY